MALQIIFEELHLEKYIDGFDNFLATYRKINSQLWREYNKGKLTKEKLRQSRFRDTLKSFGIDNVSLGNLIEEKYVSISPRQTHLFPNTHEVLQELLEAGYQLSIITNGFTEVQYVKLKNCGLERYFSSILCSEEIGLNKPHPKVFYEALNRAKARISQSVMIGDDLISDVKGAENIGMRAVLFDPMERYKSEFPRVRELQEVPELIINLR
ncbi:MAG: YjjG family noncanonical pyrimidine nucleotidase [Brumimicrobium sp.]|nr:YjjG family noncanonical pyrimidine nucleotidase [Brumimicrobium sp.]